MAAAAGESLPRPSLPPFDLSADLPATNHKPQLRHEHTQEPAPLHGRAARDRLPRPRSGFLRLRPVSRRLRRLRTERWWRRLGRRHGKRPFQLLHRWRKEVSMDNLIRAESSLRPSPPPPRTPRSGTRCSRIPRSSPETMVALTVASQSRTRTTPAAAEESRTCSKTYCSKRESERPVLIYAEDPICSTWVKVLTFAWCRGSSRLAGGEDAPAAAGSSGASSFFTGSGVLSIHHLFHGSCAGRSDLLHVHCIQRTP